MPVSNSDIADLFDEAADLLEIQAANPFRVRAYRNASRVIRNWPTSLSSILHQGKTLPKMPGIGEDLAGKIEEAVRTRKLGIVETLKKKTPAGLLELLQIPGLGPKRVAKLQAELKVQSAKDLEGALARGEIRDVEGFGQKIEERLRAELKLRQGVTEARLYLARAEQIAEPLLAHLRACPAVERLEVAGSYRRRRDTVGDLDILASCQKGCSGEVMKSFLAYEDVERVLAEGETKSTVVMKSRLQVDLRVVGEESFGAALHYFTGSKAHNIAIRSLGMKRGLKINEYGVFKGKRQLSGRVEADVFAAVGLPFIEPELREDQGEIAAARAGNLPQLVSLSDIRGDLHAHTKATDGRGSLREMAEAAIALGYEYLAITDHSRHLTVARGLDPRRLVAQMREIDHLNEELAKGSRRFRVLKSIEVDILESGELDLPNSVLSALDLTICSIHSHFELPPKKQLLRILRAMDHPSFHILGHPTGRLIGKRPPMGFDLETIIEAAKERGCFLEVNAQPERMDLADQYCRMAHEIGAKIVISTDAHSENDLGFMKFGVSQARRGWLSAQEVLNTRSWREIERVLSGRGSQALAA